jgi:hypothetical protein
MRQRALPGVVRHVCAAHGLHQFEFSSGQKIVNFVAPYYQDIAVMHD